MIANILNALANSPTIYGASVVFLSLLSALLAVIPALPPRLRRSGFASTGFFFFATTLTVLIGRWPSMRFDDFISVDEAQMLAQALTLAHYPIPWKFYDPTTSGPLNSAILDLPRLVGMFPTYASNRLIAAVLIVILLVALYDIVQRTYGELAGRLATLPPLVFFSLETSPEFTDYPSELLSICLIAVTMDLVLSMTSKRDQLSFGKIAIAGILLGALPFSKLQAIPFVALLAATAVYLIVRNGALAPIKRRAIGLFALGLLACPLLILPAVAASGAFRDFVLSYVALPYMYVRSNCCHFAGRTFFFGETLFAVFEVSCIAIASLQRSP